jgi:hypothetical protein
MWENSLCVGISGISPFTSASHRCALITSEEFPDATGGTDAPTPQLTGLMLNKVPVWVANYCWQQTNTEQT